MAARDATVSVAPMTEEEQHEHDTRHPPLPGSRQHTCTDVFWLFFLLLNLGCMGYIHHYASVHGNYKKITRGYNSDNQICGVDKGQLDNGYIYWCEDPETDDIIETSPICVSHCPNGTEQHSDCDNEVFVGKNENRSTFDADVYPSLAIGHWCLPRKRSTMAKLLRQVMGNCPLAPVMEVFGDIHRSGIIILPAAGLVSVCVGYLYLYLLDKCASLLCYVCMLLLVGSTGGSGGCLVWGALFGDPESYSPYLAVENADLIVGTILLTVAFLSFFLFCCKSTNIDQACGCIEASCECLMEEPTLLIEPFLSMTIKAAALIAMGEGYANLATTGEVKLTGTSGIRRDIVFDNEEWAYMIFYVFIFFWVMEMASAASQYVLAWTTQMWYFTPYVNGHKDAKLTCGVIQGYFNLLRYHLGTIAVGALIIVYCRVLRALFGLIAETAKMEGNPVARVLATCCLCCITCFQRFLQALNKNAYMDVAITSSNFCPAAARSLDLLTKEVPAVAALNGTQVIFQICGVGLITCSTVWSMMVCTSSLKMFRDFGSPYYISNRVGVCVVAGMQAAFIGICFMHVFDTVGDTILYCFASEQRRRALVDHKAAGEKAEAEQTWWAWLVGEDSETSDEEAADYAPKKLKALVERHS